MERCESAADKAKLKKAIIGGLLNKQSTVSRCIIIINNFSIIITGNTATRLTRYISNSINIIIIVYKVPGKRYSPVEESNIVQDLWVLLDVEVCLELVSQNVLHVLKGLYEKLIAILILQEIQGHLEGMEEHHHADRPADKPPLTVADQN